MHAPPLAVNETVTAMNERSLSCLLVVMCLLGVLAGGRRQVLCAGPPAELSELVGHAGKDPPPGRPAAQKAWVRCDRWADSRTPETFARDVLRIEAERIKYPEDKAVKVRDLYEIVRLAQEHDLPLNVGTEMNKYGLKLVDDLNVPELVPVRQAFLDGALFI